MSTPTIVSAVCPKCGTSKKTGKRSCCASSGAWFKNCGDVGDTKFDHTWTEGIRACKGLVTLVPVQSTLERMLHHARVFVYPHKTAQLRNATQQQTNRYSTGSMSDTGTSDPETHVGVAKVLIYICVLFPILRLQT